MVAFAIAGRINIDLTREPLGLGADGLPVYLCDIWPGSDEIARLLPLAMDPAVFREKYADFTRDHDLWNSITSPAGETYDWPPSTYIAEPPFFSDFTDQPPPLQAVTGARALLLLGDSVTTDHISPAGAFGEATPAGRYLLEHGVARPDFNSYGSRRGNHEVMMRGTFANVRIKNLMLPPRADGSRTEGGFTLLDGRQATVFDAAMQYQARVIPTVVLAGEEYGTGSSRDWAAKGTYLLGVRAVIARSFERIHRSNLVGMGVLPLQFAAGDSIETLGLDGTETYAVEGDVLIPQAQLTLVIGRTDGSVLRRPVLSRIDTPIEADYYRHGGILPFVLRQLLAG